VYKFLKKIQCRFDRIETTTGSGVPDLDFTHKGINYKIELKIVKDRRMSFRPSQINWHSLETKAGGSPMVLAYDESLGQMYYFPMHDRDNYEKYLIKDLVHILKV
jgi:hypothetical protein